MSSLFSYSYFDPAIRDRLTLGSGKHMPLGALKEGRGYLRRVNRRRGKLVPNIRQPNHINELRAWSPRAKQYVPAGDIEQLPAWAESDAHQSASDKATAPDAVATAS